MIAPEDHPHLAEAQAIAEQFAATTLWQLIKADHEARIALLQSPTMDADTPGKVMRLRGAVEQLQVNLNADYLVKLALRGLLARDQRHAAEAPTPPADEPAWWETQAHSDVVN